MAGPRATWRAHAGGVKPGRAKPLVADISGQGHPVVLLHGQPGTAGDWAAVSRELEQDHLVVAPDRPGYGRTGGRAAGFLANAEQVAELMDRLDLGPAVVVGHSWGGGVALALALAYPERVCGVVLVASVSPFEPAGHLDRLLARPLVGRALVAASLSTVGRLLSWGPGRAFAGWRLRSQPHQQIEELARSWRRPATWASFAVEQRALVHELPVMATLMGAAAGPFLVLTGSLDRVVPVPTARRLAARLPAARLETVVGAGHLLPQMHPGAVAHWTRQICPGTAAAV